MEVQITFRDPLVVSSVAEPDYLEVKFWDQRPFMSQEGYHVPNQYRISRQVPPQRPDDGSFSTLLAFTGLLKGALILAGAAGFLIAFLLSAGFHLLWSLLNDLGLLIHMPIFDITFPANAMTFYGAIAQVAQFDLIDTQETINLVAFFGLDEGEEPYSVGFELLGYGARNFIINLGSVFLIWAVLLFAIVLSLPFLLASRWSETARVVYKAFSDWVYWNVPLRLFLQSLFEIVLCGMMDINLMNLSTPGYVLSFGLACLFMLATVAYALWIPLFLKKNEEKLLKPKTKSVYGEVYSGLWMRQIVVSLRQAEAFVYRRVAYAAICYYTFN